MSNVDPDAHNRYKAPLTPFQVKHGFVTNADKVRRGAISAGHRRGTAKLKEDLATVTAQRDRLLSERDLLYGMLAVRMSVPAIDAVLSKLDESTKT